MGEWVDWRRSRHRVLTAETGNLALIETRWLDDGEEPPRGHGLTTPVRRTHPVTGRMQRGFRRWDPQSPAVRAFVGTNPYPFDPAWVRPARFVPTGPNFRSPFQHRNDNGIARDLPVPGHIVVTIEGIEHTLLGLDNDGDLLLVFGDLTNGRETYGGGRFLILPWEPEATSVVLDFNRAVTPPCGFSPHYNCPLPPPENRLPFAIEAGERLPVFQAEPSGLASGRRRRA
jgi:uncharacterized protein (DUF1684 family)